ncbi:Isovaleryl-CoA dehydrogenase [Actinobacteria bacterium OK074]|nr:Isovaleryl-CoA dehydrogenase [Actinobacteria bacterium OK074]
MSATPSPANPYLTPDHVELARQADAFAEGEVAARVERMEAKPGKVEQTLARYMAARGWFGVTIPRRYGGKQAGHTAKTVLINHVARVSAATAAILQAGLIPVAALLHFGTDDQKTRLLPAVAAGEVLLSIAATEPEHGGHIGGIQTSAERDGNEWVITGSKAHIGNSHLAHLHVVIARTAPPGTSASRALTAFLIEHDRPGVSRAPHRPALGLHGFSFGRLNLDRVRVPESSVLGAVGEGMDIAQSTSILYGRPNLAAVSLGLHEATVELTACHLRQRPRYDGTLADLPVLRDRLGGMAGRLRGARDLAYQAVSHLDRGQASDDELINSKLQGHTWAARSAQDALELHGAAGLSMDYPLQRLWRDTQCIYPPAGTGEFQRIHLAKTALGETRTDWSQRLADHTRQLHPAPITAA